MVNPIFVSPFLPAFGIDGLLSPGAKMYFYNTGTLDLADIFDADGDPLTNPVVADQAGRFPEVYLGDEADYRVRLEAANGTLIDEADPYQNIFAVISAPDGSSFVGYNQGGIGAIDRTVQSRLRDRISVKDFGAVGDGSVDDTLAFKAAVSFAISNGHGAVYVPACSVAYKITSTVTMGQLKMYGDGVGSSVIRPTIADGTAVFSFSAGSNFFHVEDLLIDNGLNLTNFQTGATNAQNCIGIKIVSNNPTFSARYAMRNVQTRGCKTGYDINGFIGTLENVWAIACETGLSGTVMNSSRLHLRFESCRKDMVITASSGLHFDQYLSEGASLQFGLLSSTVDSSNGITFTAPYFEQPRLVPFISFGVTTLCRSIAISGLQVAMADTAGSDYDSYPLAFDKVDGLEIAGNFSTGFHRNFYSNTTSTKNIVDKSIPQTEGQYWGPHDNSLNLSVVRNLFPNSNFDMWFRGWPAVAPSNLTATQETTIVRRGKNAIRLTATAAATQGYLQFQMTDIAFVTPLRGKTLSCYAWVWVPNTADFDPDTSPIPTVVYLNFYADGTGGGVTTSQTNAMKRGAWNLIKVTKTIPVDATIVYLYPVMQKATGTFSGSEFVVVDSMFLVEGDGQDIAIRNGWVTSSDLIPCIGIGGRAVIRSDTAPSDADQTYEQGDVVWKYTMTAGASPGWNCTAGGVGGVAVFTAKANNS